MAKLFRKLRDYVLFQVGSREAFPYVLVRKLIEGIQIGTQRPRKHNRVLRNDRHIGSQSVQADLLDVDSIDFDD